MDAFDQINSEFESDIERLEHLLSIVNLLREFGGSQPPSAVSDPWEWDEATSLLERAKEKRTDMPIFSGSLLLYLCGRFEYFFRNVVEATAEEYAEKCQTFGELPRNLQKSLVKFTSEVAQNGRKYGYDFIQVKSYITTLSDNFLAESGLDRVNSSCVSLTESNMRPDLVQELLSRVNISDFWKEVGKQNRVKYFFETRGDKETTDAAKSLLNEIMDERNAVAHPTASTEFPDTDKVMKHASYLKLIAKEGIDVIRVQLGSFTPDG